jgi:hypothetical protein
MRAVAFLLLALSASHFARGSEVRPQTGAVNANEHKESSRKLQAIEQYGDLDTLVTLIQQGKLAIKGLDASNKAQPAPFIDVNVAPKEPQQAAQELPTVAAPAPTAEHVPLVPIVAQPKGSLACRHQYQYGEHWVQAGPQLCLVLVCRMCPVASLWP